MCASGPVPSPRTSGTAVPARPVITAATNNNLAGDQPDLAAKRAEERIANMNSTATMPKTGPATRAEGNICVISKPLESIENSGSTSKILSVNQTALMLAIAIGAMALMEKCLRMASCAKISPAMGALKPAAIAPATPHPMNTSVVSTPPVICRRKLPIVAPKCTSGPYCPTDAPPLAEMKAASVDPKPARTSSSLSARCAA